MKSLRKFFVSRFGLGRDRTQSEGNPGAGVGAGTVAAVQDHGDDKDLEEEGVLDSSSESYAQRRIGILEVLVDFSLLTDAEARLILNSPNQADSNRR